MSAKIFKIEVPDYGSDEINRMAAAHEALHGLPFDAQPRCLEWLIARITADRQKKMDAGLDEVDPQLVKTET